MTELYFFSHWHQQWAFAPTYTNEVVNVYVHWHQWRGYPLFPLTGFDFMSTEIKDEVYSLHIDRVYFYTNLC